MARYRKRARAQAIATTPEAAKPSSSKVCKVSCYPCALTGGFCREHTTVLTLLLVDSLLGASLHAHVAARNSAAHDANMDDGAQALSEVFLLVYMLSE